MNQVATKLGSLLFGLFGLVITSHAALTPLDNGLVNDDVLDITWMQDTNLVKTSCDANNALWQAFNPTTVVSNSERTKAQICTDADNGNGTLNWFEAEAWIAVLNAKTYLGYADWRQPATPQPDASCEYYYPRESFGAGCTGSELGNLFYVSLGNTEGFTITAPFDNAGSFAWWSGTVFAPSEGALPAAWLFRTSSAGYQIYDSKDRILFVWPVRSGQSVVVPPPKNNPTLSAIALLILIGS